MCRAIGEGGRRCPCSRSTAHQARIERDRRRHNRAQERAAGGAAVPDGPTLPERAPAPGARAATAGWTWRGAVREWVAGVREHAQEWVEWGRSVREYRAERREVLAELQRDIGAARCARLTPAQRIAQAYELREKREKREDAEHRRRVRAEVDAVKVEHLDTPGQWAVALQTADMIAGIRRHELPADYLQRQRDGLADIQAAEASVARWVARAREHGARERELTAAGRFHTSDGGVTPEAVQVMAARTEALASIDEKRREVAARQAELQAEALAMISQLKKG